MNDDRYDDRANRPRPYGGYSGGEQWNAARSRTGRDEIGHGARSGPEAGYEGGYEGWSGAGRHGSHGTGGGQSGQAGGYERAGGYGSRDTTMAGQYMPGSETLGRRFEAPGGAQANWDGGSYRGDDGYAGDRSFRRGMQRISPKGYARSGERIREDVYERLSRSGLDVREVSVNVSQARVTLQGTVPDRRSKHAIEDIADDCAGVEDVDNRIRVQRGGDTSNTALSSAY